MAPQANDIVLASDGEALSQALKKGQSALRRLMGSPEMAIRAATVVYVLVRRTPDLQKCSVESIVNGMIQSAQLGLELGTEAHLVPFKNRDLDTYEAAFIPDWKGLVRLAIRAKAITAGHGDIVYKEDDYVCRRTGESVEFQHDRKRFGPRAKKDTVEEHIKAGCQGVYFIGYRVTGPPVVAELTVSDVEYVRRTYSKMADGKLWTQRWSAGAIKTAAKQALKVVPQSQELTTAIELDNRAETGIESGVLNGDERAVEPYREPQPKKLPPAEEEDAAAVRAEDAKLAQE
jgi:recombination protein RecT